MSNFTNILLTYVQNKSQQLEILHFIYCVINNISYGKLLVIKGSPININSSKYDPKREMDYDNLLNEIKKQCGTKCCTLKGLSLCEKKDITNQRCDGLAYFKYYEDGEKMSDLEFFATKNNVILLVENEMVFKMKNYTTVAIQKSTFNLNYSLDDLTFLNMTPDMKTKFFDFVASHNVEQSIVTNINTELLLQNAMKSQLELESKLASTTNDKSQLETMLFDMSTLKLDLESQLETISDAKVKLENELLDMSNSRLNLTTQLFEALTLKSKLESELEIIKTSKRPISNTSTSSASKIPRFNLASSTKKPVVSSVTSSTKSSVTKPKTNQTNALQKQTPKTKPKSTF